MPSQKPFLDQFRAKGYGGKGLVKDMNSLSGTAGGYITEATHGPTETDGFEFCVECDGTGNCASCGGTGDFQDGGPCPDCGGAGNCLHCGGAGMMPKVGQKSVKKTRVPTDDWFDNPGAHAQASPPYSIKVTPSQGSYVAFVENKRGQVAFESHRYDNPDEARREAQNWLSNHGEGKALKSKVVSKGRYNVTRLGPGDSENYPDFGRLKTGYYVLEGEEIVDGPFKTEAEATEAANEYEGKSLKGTRTKRPLINAYSIKIYPVQGSYVAFVENKQDYQVVFESQKHDNAAEAKREAQDWLSNNKLLKGARTKRPLINAQDISDIDEWLGTTEAARYIGQIAAKLGVSAYSLTVGAAANIIHGLFSHGASPNEAAGKLSKTLKGKPMSTKKRRKAVDETDDEAPVQPQDEGFTEMPETEIDDEAVVDKDAVDEPFSPKHSAKVLAKLYRHHKDAADYIDEEMKGSDLDHPGVAEALTEHKDAHISPAMEHLKATLHEHHKGEEDIDPDGLMDKHLKGLETDGTGGGETQPGEAGLVSTGNIPEEEELPEEPDGVIEESEIGSPEWEAEEAEEPEHKEEVEGAVDKDTEEILERYETPKGWKTRKAGVIRRAKNGKVYLVKEAPEEEEEKDELGKDVIKDDEESEEKDELGKDVIKADDGDGEELDNVKEEALKDTSEFMEKLADEDDMPNKCRAGLKHHAKKLLWVSKSLSIKKDHEEAERRFPYIGSEKGEGDEESGDPDNFGLPDTPPFKGKEEDEAEEKDMDEDTEGLVKAVDEAEEFAKDVAEEEEVPKLYKSGLRNSAKRLAMVSKALTDEGKVQRDGGKGSPLSDKGKLQRDGGGKGSDLSDKGELEADTQAGKKRTEIITGSGKPDKGKALDPKVLREYENLRKQFHMLTGIKVNGN